MKEFLDFRVSDADARIKRLPLPPHLYRLLSTKPIKYFLKVIFKQFSGKEIRAKLPYVDPDKSKAFTLAGSNGIWVKGPSLINII